MSKGSEYRIKAKRAVRKFTEATRATGSATRGLQVFESAMPKKPKPVKKPSSSPGLVQRAHKALSTKQEKRNPRKRF